GTTRSSDINSRMVLTITDDSSLSEHLSRAGSKLVVIDFYADWCGPCRSIAPIFEQFALQYTEAFFVKVNVDLCTQTSALYGIQAMPTFVFLRNNQEVGRLMGADAAELEKKIVRCIADAGSTPSYSPNVATQEEEQFLKKYFHYSRRMQNYEDEVAQTLALSVIPSDDLKAQSLERGKLDEFRLVKNLLRWFKVEFFKWVDTPECESCGVVTRAASKKKGTPSKEEREFGADRVEVYVCDSCAKDVRFPRYNDPVKLLETRKGRCGEWANCFVLCSRALQLETRWVHDETDHVWCEVWINSLDRWVHCDPCENIIDTPLLYERGWGKKLTYVIAFGADHVRDVTWRYTFDHFKVLRRRSACRESVLLNFFKKLNARYEKTMFVERKKEMDRRYLKELIEFLSPSLQLREGSEVEHQGRTTGSVKWREARNELGGSSKSPPISVVLRPNDNELASKYFRLEYTCAKDEYKRGNEVIRGWGSLLNKQIDVFRNEESDWKMSYICRKEGKSIGELCWSLDLEGLCIKTLSIELKGITKYEDGIVTATVCCGDVCIPLHDSSKLTLESPKDGRVDIKVIFSGGTGQRAWQNAQLFRSELKSSEPDMIVAVELK
uniref:Peptide-N(4)-(N-acetyl-beta-glucosaminyl)asparagine amidase n=2 Tax=Parascaris univalens TaxID=6257 RepID=A0A914ZZZ7_PARUN